MRFQSSSSPSVCAIKRANARTSRLPCVSIKTARAQTAPSASPSSALNMLALVNPHNNFISTAAVSYKPFYRSRQTATPLPPVNFEAATANVHNGATADIYSSKELVNDDTDSSSRGSAPRLNRMKDSRHGSPHEDDLVIAVMGLPGSGKTTFINLITGGTDLPSPPYSTSAVQAASPFELNDRWITLIDTPGLEDTATLTQIAYTKGKKLAGVIYMHRITDIRTSGLCMRNLKMFRQLCGEQALRNVVIVTTMWGDVAREVGEAREKQLASDEHFFKPFLDKGARMLRHNNGLTSAHAILYHLTRNRPRALRIQRELVDEGKDIMQTAAGAELNPEYAEQAIRHREEIARVQEEMRSRVAHFCPMLGRAEGLTVVVHEKEESKSKLLAASSNVQMQINRVEDLNHELGKQRKVFENEITTLKAEMKEGTVRESEHASEVEQLNREMVEERKRHAEEIETSRQETMVLNLEKEQLNTELRELGLLVEEFRRQSSEQSDRHREESTRSQEILEGAIREANTRTEEELSAQAAKYEVQMQDEHRRLVVEYAKQRAELEERMAVQAEKARLDAQTEAEQLRLELQTAKSAMKSRMEELQSRYNGEKEEFLRRISELQLQNEQLRGILALRRRVTDPLDSFLDFLNRHR
ncbi:hypothetical protein R3P38DRAFT_3504057 [Favolaschia claudopus]|uniref:G domain-containing protein n=1 Tax=Favolaschia claudopus TaxID=2862362 RepID=A0AAW0C2I4_9AGAR